MMENVKNAINYKTFFRKIKEDTNKWRHSLCSWVENVNTVTMSVSPNVSIVSAQCQLILQQAFLEKLTKSLKTHV